jgi:hypothetical protein
MFCSGITHFPAPGITEWATVSTLNRGAQRLCTLLGLFVARLHWFAIRDAKILGEICWQTKFTRREQIENGADI